MIVEAQSQGANNNKIASVMEFQEHKFYELVCQTKNSMCGTEGQKTFKSQ